MTENEMTALRLLIREETNAAVYASEQRIGERFEQLGGHIDRLEGRMGQFESRMGQFEGRVGRVEGQLDRLEAGQRDIQVKFMQLETNVSEAVSVLDDVTRVINDLQSSQHAIELKLEDNLFAMRKDILKLTETIHNFAREFIDMHVRTNERMTRHERTPVNETHPRPYPAA